MKATLRDGGIGVSLLLRIPGMTSDGRVERALVSHLDIYPTLCDVLGFASPPWLAGRSLLPLLRGTCDSVRDLIFAETNYHAVYEPARCARTKRHKFIRHFGEAGAPRPANVDDSVVKEIYNRQGYFTSSRAREELYDLEDDPAEQRNLADDPAHQDVRDQLAQSLNDWMVESSDPLLRGSVPRPEGSRLNRDNAWSPTEPSQG
jgi:arylsulfatase A-like enzyme